MRRFVRIVRAGVSGCLLLALGGAGAASAAPPEGCIGFPDIPEAFLCVTQWTPGNAVPTVTPGPDQTYTVPEFCVFDCFGPTPVTVPGVTVTPGSGVVAVLTYDGQTYHVTVPPAGSTEETVRVAQEQVADAVTAVLATADGAADAATEAVGDAAGGAYSFAIVGTMRIDCFGCGYTSGSLAGTFAGVVNGVATTGNAAGDFLATTNQSECPLTGTASGRIAMPRLGQVLFEWTMVGGIAVVTYHPPGGGFGSGFGTFLVTDPVGNPCGLPVSATITLSGAGF